MESHICEGPEGGGVQDQPPAVYRPTTSQQVSNTTTTAIKPNVQVAPQVTQPAITLVPTLSAISSTIPVWVKGIFNYHGQGQISDNELINAISFLVQQGVIKLK